MGGGEDPQRPHVHRVQGVQGGARTGLDGPRGGRRGGGRGPVQPDQGRRPGGGDAAEQLRRVRSVSGRRVHPLRKPAQTGPARRVRAWYRHLRAVRDQAGPVSGATARFDVVRPRQHGVLRSRPHLRRHAAHERGQRRDGDGHRNRPPSASGPSSTPCTGARERSRWR